jgi:hypothetical protein
MSEKSALRSKKTRSANGTTVSSDPVPAVAVEVATPIATASAKTRDANSPNRMIPLVPVYVCDPTLPTRRCERIAAASPAWQQEEVPTCPAGA